MQRAGRFIDIYIIIYLMMVVTWMRPMVVMNHHPIRPQLVAAAAAVVHA
jgi:hypothetical protein